jgi:hypothetical protein
VVTLPTDVVGCHPYGKHFPRVIEVWVLGLSFLYESPLLLKGVEMDSSTRLSYVEVISVGMVIVVRQVLDIIGDNCFS